MIHVCMDKEFSKIWTTSGTLEVSQVWLHLDMTEKLLTGTLNLNTNKKSLSMKE